MIVITTLDDNYGLMFNKRRLSQDQMVTLNIIHLVGDGILNMDNKSMQLFAGIPNNCTIVASDKDCPCDFKFVEFEDPMKYNPEVIYVYRWNRKYPSDVRVDLTGYNKEVILEFEGYSHNKITLERYYK